MHLPLVAQIRLVAHEHDDHVVAALRTHVVHPFRCVLERGPVCVPTVSVPRLCLSLRLWGIGHLLVISYTTTATDESRMYDGINDRNRSYTAKGDPIDVSFLIDAPKANEVWALTCPAVSQSCSLTVLSSRYMVLERKSIPMVAWYVLSNVSYINRVINDVFPTDCSPKNTSCPSPNMPISRSAFHLLLPRQTAFGWEPTLNLRSGWPNSAVLAPGAFDMAIPKHRDAFERCCVRGVRLVGIQKAVADRDGRIESVCVDRCCLERSVMCVCASCGAGEMDERMGGVGVVLGSSASGGLACICPWDCAVLCLARVPHVPLGLTSPRLCVCAAVQSLSRESRQIQTPNAASLLTLRPNTLNLFRPHL